MELLRDNLTLWTSYLEEEGMETSVDNLGIKYDIFTNSKSPITSVMMVDVKYIQV